MVRKISGKQPSGEIHHLHANGSEVTELPDIANTIGQTARPFQIIHQSITTLQNSKLFELELKLPKSATNQII